MNYKSESVRFNNINVTGIYTNSGIFIGDNQQNFWSSHTKSNTGFGETNGENIIYKPINLVIDPDHIDHPIRHEKNSYE